MTPFDTVLVVDWSGGNDRGQAPAQDAIWACLIRQGTVQEPLYFRNRQTAEAWITATLDAEIAAQRRVFAGFDFAFSYPDGFGKALTQNDDPLSVWDWLEAKITDSPSANNRFEIAGEINAIFGGNGPFWGNARPNVDIEGLPRTKANYRNPFADKRGTDRLAKGSFSPWQLAGAGAVGSQTLMGLPMLARLRRKYQGNIGVWPFEPVSSAITLAEIWPTLFTTPTPDGMIKDAWQVRETAKNIANMSNDQIQGLLQVHSPTEGWIFGIPAPIALRNDCFSLPEGVHWTPVNEALALLRARLSTVTSVSNVALREAHGRIASGDIHAARANPPLPNTAVDGYGFKGGRGDGPHVFPLMTGRAAAGDAPGTLAEGHAIRVLTGAALPEGVDTVVLQEDVKIEGQMLAFNGPINPGANTRLAGEDAAKGKKIIARGDAIGAPQLAILAATGVDSVPVHEKLRVAIISTGSELVEAGSTATSGQIYDANRPMLNAMVRDFGHIPVDMGRCPDDRNGLRDFLDRAARQADVIITSGGASAGDEDHVSALLQDAGAMSLWRIALKPGRPLALGMWDGKPVFGLPGNPVAALVCTLVFARPALAQMAGQNWQEPTGFMVPAAFTKRKKAGRTEYLRARIAQNTVEVFASEGSGRISGLSWADGLVELPPEALTIRHGDLVRYIPFASFGLR